MRFNPKARLDTGRVGNSGRSSGGGMGGSGQARLPIPGGVKAGGGAGMLVVILLVVAVSCLGGNGGGLGSAGGMLDPGAGNDSGRMNDTERYAHCETGADANEDVDCARVAVENSLYAFWSETMEQEGQQFRPASLTTFSGAVATGCGQANSQVGPFYCPADAGIYLDASFFAEVLEGQLGGQGGDFVEPYVLAHEYGHHIQNLMGTMGKVRTQQGPKSDAVRLELQADCYAGMWTRAAEGTDNFEGVALFDHLDQADISEALDSAKAVGDDRIQQRSSGRVDSDGWTHGSSAQRMEWFSAGYESGRLDQCDTFAPSAL